MHELPPITRANRRVRLPRFDRILQQAHPDVFLPRLDPNTERERLPSPCEIFADLLPGAYEREAERFTQECTLAAEQERCAHRRKTRVSKTLRPRKTVCEPCKRSKLKCDGSFSRCMRNFTAAIGSNGARV